MEPTHATPWSVPSSAFNQVNISTNAALTSYKNADLQEIKDGVYHFAQQKESKLLMTLSDVAMQKAQVEWYDRFGKLDLVSKTAEGPDTPLATADKDTRGLFCQPLHQGFQLDKDTAGLARYSISANIQRSISYAYGRNIDRVIQAAAFSPVLSRAVVAAQGWAGAVTVSTSDLPDTSYFACLNDDGTALSKLDTKNLDDLAQSFEDDDIDPEEPVYIPMSPALRKQLKQISEFRNKENSLGMTGSEVEQRGMIRFGRFVFVSLTKDVAIGKLSTAIKIKGGTGADRNQKDDGSGTVDVATTANYLATIAYTSDAIRFRTQEGGTWMRLGERDDKSYLDQLYFHTSIGAMRNDDSKVRLLVIGE